MKDVGPPELREGRCLIPLIGLTHSENPPCTWASTLEQLVSGLGRLAGEVSTRRPDELRRQEHAYLRRKSVQGKGDPSLLRRPAAWLSRQGKVCERTG
jgi:hypothetical protein